MQDRDIGNTQTYANTFFMDFHYVNLPSFYKITFLAILCLPAVACMQSIPTASFEGLKTSKLVIEKNSRGQVGTLPLQLAEAIKTCWVERDELFEGFKINQQGNIIMLNGPIIGNPPQRFLISFNENVISGYIIEMEYPKGSNYQFVRSRVVRDLRKLESGLKPCN